jgi:hypothetical protein
VAHLVLTGRKTTARREIAVSFVLPNGNFTLNDLSAFLAGHYGDFSKLKDANTPQARDFLKRLNALQGLRNEAALKSPNGKLSTDQMSKLRSAVGGISDAQRQAQRSQLAEHANARPGDAPTAHGKDPYRDSHGKVYRTGPSEEDVRQHGKAFHEGDSGEGVKSFQKMLIQAGFDVGRHGADGFYGTGTADASRKFFAGHKDLNNTWNRAALERLAGIIEGLRSARGGGTDSK